MRTVKTMDDEAPKKVDKRTMAWKEASAQGKRTADDRKRGTTHQGRDAETREAEEVHQAWDEPWVRSGTLPSDIPARPGMVQRWIRVSSRGENDTTNVSRKFREGWVPRKAETLPKGFMAPTIERGSFVGCIGVEGMILCEMPKSRNDQRNAYFQKRKNTQTDAVNQQLAEASKHGVKGFGNILKAEKTEVGRLREVKVASEDEI